MAETLGSFTQGHPAADPDADYRQPGDRDRDRDRPADEMPDLGPPGSPTGGPFPDADKDTHDKGSEQDQWYERLWKWMTGGLETIWDRYTGELAFEQNKKMSDYAFNQNLEMWKMQNEYNHPASQMARLKEAGINPRMLYGTGAASAVGQAKELPKYQAPQANYNSGLFNVPLAGLGAYLDYRLKNAQVDNVQADTELTRKKTITEGYAAFLKKVEGHLKEWDIKYSKQSFYDRVLKNKLLNAVTARQFKLMEKNLTLKEREIILANQRIAEQELKNVMRKFGLTDNSKWFVRTIAMAAWNEGMTAEDFQVYLKGKVDQIWQAKDIWGLLNLLFPVGFNLPGLGELKGTFNKGALSAPGVPGFGAISAISKFLTK